MKSFFGSLITLFVLAALMLCYRIFLTSFATDLAKNIESLPSTTDGIEENREDALPKCEKILDDFRKHELLIHLALPYERVESMHEKLILLTEYCRAGASSDFCSMRALCLEEAEILKKFEELSAQNFI